MTDLETSAVSVTGTQAVPSKNTTAYAQMFRHRNPDRMLINKCIHALRSDLEDSKQRQQTFMTPGLSLFVFFFGV